MPHLSTNIFETIAFNPAGVHSIRAVVAREYFRLVKTRNPNRIIRSGVFCSLTGEGCGLLHFLSTDKLATITLIQFPLEKSIFDTLAICQWINWNSSPPLLFIDIDRTPNDEARTSSSSSSSSSQRDKSRSRDKRLFCVFTCVFQWKEATRRTQNARLYHPDTFAITINQRAT